MSYTPLTVLRFAAKWLLIASAVACLCGSASALFLWSLDWVTSQYQANRWLIWLLPLAGFAVAWVYHRLGQQAEAGNNLLIDEIHDPKQVVPLRMAPFILGATLVSHLFGASVGREGTAVQMGGALADQVTRWLRLDREDRRMLLMSGIAAGFASVFGTPLAGAVFALEVLAIGRMRYEALFPCLTAAVIADQICRAWGIEHGHYVVTQVPAITVWGLLAVLCAGTVFGLAGKIFADATHTLTHWMRQHLAYAPWRPVAGGVAIALCGWFLPVERYLGLGLPVMAEAFTQPLPLQDFVGKLVFTVMSIGTGFKGGEVTPLFYMGATLGNALAPWLHLPFDLLAAVGFVAVFAGAANTPIACTLLALEIFGSGVGVYAALGCVTAYLCSGHSGIYRAQRDGHVKHQPRA